NGIAGRNLRAGKYAVALNCADAEAGEIIVARRIHSRHLGSLAADQRAAGAAAALGDRGDDRGRALVVEIPGGVIIKEKQRLGALYNEIVGAHRDEVDANPVMPPSLDREL